MFKSINNSTKLAIATWLTFQIMLLPDAAATGCWAEAHHCTPVLIYSFGMFPTEAGILQQSDDYV